MTPIQRKKEAIRLRKIAKKGNASLRKRLGEEGYKKHLSEIGKLGAAKKWS